MKQFLDKLLKASYLLIALGNTHAIGQATNMRAGIAPIHAAHATNAMSATPKNYQWFTTPYKNTSEEAVTANAGYEQNPETGLLFTGTPCDNCYELVGKRTEKSKTFMKEGTSADGGKDIYQQTSTESMHYKDASGNWLTVKTQLEPDNDHAGVYAAYHQPIPVTIHTNASENFSTIGTGFKFNHNLELIYAKPGVPDISLGKANWTNYTAGDDGVYVTNAWQGVDIEIYQMRGALKTNFIINHAMPVYADGQLLVRDHLQLDNGLSLYAGGEKKHNGILEIRNSAGEMKYAMSEASVAEKNNFKATFRTLNYYIGDNNTVDIALPGEFLSRPASSYPVIIDPLVSTNTSVAVAGSSYSAAWTSGCSYANPANVPANCTVTDIQFTFQYTATGGAWTSEGAYSFYLGTCRNPGTAAGGLSWTCTGFGGGTCTATPASSYSIYSDLAGCVPAPSCPSYPLNLTMQFYQNYNPTAACASTYVFGSQPLVITVIGHTVELTAAGVTATPATICAGNSSNLNATGTYGVPPYTYSWAPGGGTGTPLTVSPATTTTYTVTVTDACGITATGTRTITVNPVTPITGNTSLCVGTTTTLSNATAGGTWLSGNTAVATVTGAGVVTGAATGTSAITYTTPAGCRAIVTVTVTPPPAAITGTTVICVGATTTLSNTTPSGTWSSGNTAIGTVDPATGVVTGIAQGTTNITYATGPGCFNFITVTVNLLAPITGNLAICAGLTSTLSDAVAGGTWSSNNAAVASINAAGVVSAITAGTATISYTVPSGCSATAIVTVSTPAPITGNLNVCVGSTTTLSNTASGATWTSSNPAIATIGANTGIVTGVSAGTLTIICTSGAGCTSSAIVTVNPLPANISGTAVVCVNSTTVLSDASAGGIWTSDNTTIASINGGGGTLTGLSGGTANITYTLPTGCLTAIVVTVNPLPLPITGTASVCKGATTALADASPGGVWSSSNTSVATVDASGLVSGIDAGNAIISYTISTGCVITVPFVVNPIPAAPLTANIDLCQMTHTVNPLTASGVSGGTLHWYTAAAGGTSVATVIPDVSADGSTTWYVSQVANGCESGRAPLTVKVHHHMPFNISASKPFLCQHDTVNLSYNGPLFTGAIYTWQLPVSATLTGGNTGNPAIDVRFDTSIANNYVYLTVGDGYTPCDIIDTLPVNVFLNAPPVKFFVKPDVCVGDEVTIALSEMVTGVTDYKWDFDTANMISASSNHGGPYIVQWDNPGKHFVTVKLISNAACPSVLMHDTVDVHPYPDARIAPIGLLHGKSQVCIGDSVFFAPLNFVDKYSYYWTPARFFNQNNASNIIGTVEAAGLVKMTVTDPYGCASTGSVLIDAQPCCTMFFPNAFTPGATSNNYFRPVTSGNHTVHSFRIANRWGQTVFESSTEDSRWDGTFNGVPQEIGVYFYFITYDCSGDKHTQKGEVMLVR